MSSSLSDIDIVGDFCWFDDDIINLKELLSVTTKPSKGCLSYIITFSFKQTGQQLEVSYGTRSERDDALAAFSDAFKLYLEPEQ